MQDSELTWPEEANVGEPWVDKFGRVRQPAVMHVADDGSRTYGRKVVAMIAARAAAPPRHRKAKMPAPVRAPRRTSAPSGRPRAAATRSSARSGDGPSDDDGGSEPDEPDAPTAAREAVAVVWERILRERHPGVAWEVVSK